MKRMIFQTSWATILGRSIITRSVSEGRGATRSLAYASGYDWRYPTRGKDAQPARKALSLLEVILALAILTGAMAVLGQVSFIGLRNAREARDMTQAELLCESKMAEITAGITPCDPVSNAYFDSQFDPGAKTSNDPHSPPWLYSIETESVDDTGLLAVRVTVVQDLPPAQRPVEVSLVRWMVDPDLEASEEDGP